MLLDDIIARAVPADVRYVLTNLVACFPREAKERGDNEPEVSEIFACRPRLIKFVNIAKPRLIVRVGKLAVSYMNFDLSVPFCDIDHPAYIARLPLAQRGMATQRAVVILRNAVTDVLKTPRTEWQPWGQEHAEGQPKREQLRNIYKAFLPNTGDDDIPF